jgi:quinol monooxygenase YgiN
MLYVTATITIKPGTEDQLVAALTHVAKLTRQEEGCVEYNLHKSADDPHRFIMIETWKSPEALEAHLKTEYVQALFAAAEQIVAEPVQISSWTRVGI